MFIMLNDALDVSGCSSSCEQSSLISCYYQKLAAVGDSDTKVLVANLKVMVQALIVVHEKCFLHIAYLCLF